jgi:hypothetical protein
VKESKMAEEQKVLDPEKEKRKIKSVKTMKDIMTTYYIDAKMAEQTPVAALWSPSS